MEQVVAAPPPLPPKTRRSPPASTATVLNGTAAEVFGYRFPEVHANHSEVSTSSANTGSHVVKIRINPQETQTVNNNKDTSASVVCEVAPCIRISVNSDTEMIQRSTMSESFIKTTPDRTNPYFFCGPFNCGTVMSSGQVSPSDTLDSGTCSDLDGTPPPLPKKKNGGVSVTVIGGHHKRASSLASSGAEVDSDDNESNISCDSLNSGELAAETAPTNAAAPSPSALETPTTHRNDNNNKSSAFLPQGLLRDIRDRSVKLSQVGSATTNNNDDDDNDIYDEPKHTNNNNNEKNRENNSKSVPVCQSPTIMLPKAVIDECTYEDRKKYEKEQQENAILINSLTYDTDRFYNFHLNEHEIDKEKDVVCVTKLNEDETFAGYRDFLGGDGSSTIRSAKGTVRGVKNRVRAGIATFLQINSTIKSYKEKDAGKVVVYTTTMGIVRETYNNCMKVKQIMRTLLVKFEERDVFMSNEYQGEIRDRMRCDHILVPQVFVDGQHIGDAETVERLNESGELRRLLKSYKSMDACTTCKVCGGYRLLPCPVCNGSKKSVHRNHFTTEFVALKCMNCDEVGLVRCTSC